MLEIGSIIDGKYKILNKIGQGGMSVVYLAMNERANKQWAVKEVRKDGVENFEVIKQGQIVETNMLKRLNHPNLPSIIDVIDQEDSFLIVMDYIEGNPLSDALAEQGVLPVEDVIEWAKQLCDVLEYLHTRKPPIIYRDMKPSNVMLKPDGSVMLIDFGTAREFKEKNVADTTCLGTQGYAAPEQFGGHGQTDARTDIYCLGATIYHLVTGHNPSEPPYELYPIRYWNPGLSSGLERIIIKCTQRNPQDRYQSCGELLYALEHYEEEDEEYKKVQNRKWYAFLTASALTVILGISTVTCSFLRTNAVANTYDSYITEFSVEKSEETKYEACRKAIALDPMKVDAYDQLLTYVGADGVFTADELEVVSSILATNLKRLKENIDAYISVTYQFGILYFYYYEGTESAANIAKWFEYATGQDGSNIVEEDVVRALGEQKALRAQNLCRMLQYYDDLNKTNKEGDKEADYGQLWLDLTAVTTDKIAEEDNNVTALVMYNFLANQLIVNAQLFIEAGVDVESMETQLSMMDMALKNLKLDTSSNSDEGNLKEKVVENIKAARNSIATAQDVVK